MMQFHALIREHSQELAELIVKENGKNITEALADGKELDRGLVALSGRYDSYH